MSSPSPIPIQSPPLAPLPTFLVIGAQKSATRWLRHNLGLHPDIYTVPREISFFSSGRRVRKLGERWYRAQFRGWTGEPIVGEACPSYMILRHDPKGVAKRIKQVVPDVRLIAILRNPVDRAQSAMFHHIKRERLPPDADLLELVRRQPPEDDWFGLVSGGRYAASLRPYRRAFGDQLLVLLHDDVRDDPTGVYAQALRHVGAAPDFVPDGLDQVIFSNREKVANGTRTLTDDDRRELFEYFRTDVRTLERMLDRDLSIWRPPRAVHPPRPRPGYVTLRSLVADAAAWVLGVVEQIGADDLGRSTPCAQWDVRALVRHLVARTRFYAAAYRRDAAAIEGVDLFAFDEGHPAAAYRLAASSLQEALGAPGALDGRIARPVGGDARAEFMSRVHFADQVAHGWDLARALGADATIPPDLLRLADGFVRQAYRSSRPVSIGPEVPLDGPASPSERFAAFLGRDPRWAPPVRPA